jgi:hypothetical protein
MGVSVPRRTARRRFRAALFDTVGVVPTGADVQFSVPVPEEARGYVLTAVVGQRDRRLRVHRIALVQARPGARRASPRRSTPQHPAATEASAACSGLAALHCWSFALENPDKTDIYWLVRRQRRMVRLV